MNDPSVLYVQNHRIQQYMIIGGMMFALVASLAPRNERALFVTGSTLAPKAFAAVAPPPAAFNGLFDDSGPYGAPRYRIGMSRRGAGRGGATPDGLLPDGAGGPVGVTPDGASPVAGGSSPIQLASLDPTGRSITGGPLAGSGSPSFGPGASSAGPATGSTPTNPTGPGGEIPGGGSSGGTLPDAPVTPVGPVPEPTTWAMMILGFFGLGAVLRRRAVSSVRAGRLQT